VTSKKSEQDLGQAGIGLNRI